MIGALRLLLHGATAPLPGKMAAFGIAGSPERFARLPRTHPPLEERIAALEAAQSL